MLHNNPMGSRRRRRFYHRAGIVPIPGEKLHEFYEVPIGFFSDFPETDVDALNEKPKTKIVSVTTLMGRLIDIINQMIELDEAETRREEEEAKAKARGEDPGAKAGPSDIQVGAGPSKVATEAAADAKAPLKDSTNSLNSKVDEALKANGAAAVIAGAQPGAE